MLFRSSAAAPESLIEVGGVSHDVGELPLHPEAAGASRPIYVGYGDSYRWMKMSMYG